MAFAIGLDFGTNSVRALVVSTESGEEIGSFVYGYPSGSAGILLDPKDPDLARQNPQDYLDGLTYAVRGALREAAKDAVFAPSRVVGIGVDTTGSTPIPVDDRGIPLALDDHFTDDLAAQAWLWKDHTAHQEAEEITAVARQLRPQYLARCGGIYSSEWYWAKILHCLRAAPQVFEAADTWVEHADWMPAVLTGTCSPDVLRRNVCAAGHKAMFDSGWGGYPDEEFLAMLDPRLVRARKRLPSFAYNVSQRAGGLSQDWASRIGLPPGIPVATGAFDAHLGAVGSGIGPGKLVKIMGTSTCDVMVAPLAQNLASIPGLCGIVPESVLPGYYGLEAGQSAVGDIFNWLVDGMAPQDLDHAALTKAAQGLRPGESGLLALDWHNGNRTVLVDQRLTGSILGLTLHTAPHELYHALIEATAFGARAILQRIEEYGVPVREIIACGGISTKNSLVMQIYSDVLGRSVSVSRSKQTSALGAAMAGAVVAGRQAGGHNSFEEAAAAMTGVEPTAYRPRKAFREVYDRLFALYMRLHDAFGVRGQSDDLYDVMKELLEIRTTARST